MNNDLISREALKEAINSSIAQATKVGIMVDADYLWELLNYAIDNAPTVEERPQGEWIFNGFCHSSTQYRCNKCGFLTLVKISPCPNCGAKMKVGAEE